MPHRLDELRKEQAILNGTLERIRKFAIEIQDEKTKIDEQIERIEIREK
jgi:uncharacterized membrane protein